MLAVKDNQKNLSEAIVDFFDTVRALDYRSVAAQQSTTVEKDHGRLETRRASLVTELSWMDKALRNDTRHAERSLRRRRKLADRRPEYRVELLGLKPLQ